jgi:UDP-N-acetylmuramate dehydrogenase
VKKAFNFPKNINIQEQIPLAPHTSWLIGGPAEYFCEPHTVEELQKIGEWSVANNISVTILGGGTNVLVSDSGIKGLVISLGKLSGVEIIESSKNLVFWAKSGTNKSELLKIFLKHKLAPAKFLAGLPGQVGGGVVMNAGVSEKLKPREFVEIVEEVEVLRPTGELDVLDAKKLKWSYRHCEGWRPGLVTRVKFTWPMEPDPKILEEVRALNQLRLKKQPLEWPSCGSVFRNPEGESAGSLIERAGLKGHIIGGAQISEKHGNFIINRGGATAADVRALMELCVRTVQERFGIELKSEVIFLN